MRLSLLILFQDGIASTLQKQMQLPHNTLTIKLSILDKKSTTYIAQSLS